MVSKPETVDEYIDSFPAEARARLRELRELSRLHAPHATEGLKWGNPAYWVETILFVFSGHKSHANFVVTPSTLEAFVPEVGGRTTGKGSIQLPYTEPVPVRLLGRMIDHRIREFTEDGVRWR